MAPPARTGRGSRSLEKRSIMMAKRAPPPSSEPQPSLPHDHDREDRQPYARELEDYKHGVANPPKEEGAHGANRRTTIAPMKK